MHPEGERRGKTIRELSDYECGTRLRAGRVGRVAICTPDGPVIIPVNYAMVEESVVVRTAPYTLLAGHAWDEAAFEIDDIDYDMRRGWSVLVVGRASPVEDVDETADPGAISGLEPWAPGSRDMLIKITPRRVTGREVAS